MVDVAGTLFDGWAEIHAFVIGFCLGTVVVVLWSPHRRAALGVLLGSLAVVLLRPTPPLEVAGRKPWYFLVAISAVVAVGTRAVPATASHREDASSEALGSDESES